MMGYTTEFEGQFALDKPLDEPTATFLRKLARTRRVARKLPEKYGVEGEFFVDSGYDTIGPPDDILDYNKPPRTQPGLWCQWIPTKDGAAIEWDGHEKFYDYVPWLEYIIDKILLPRGYVLNGNVDWRGQSWEDTGTISVRENCVSVGPTKAVSV